ncbi:MAG: hypothetical protein WCP28_06910 [Actinomycetes bacterium]
MADQNYILYAATYASVEDAKLDLSAIKVMQESHEVHRVTAAIVSKNDKGRIHVHETTQTGKVTGVSGIIVGAIIGAVFPPAGLAVVGGAAAGGAALGILGGAIGHFAGGISRKDLRAVGAMLDEGQAALIAVAVDAPDSDIDGVLSHAVKTTNQAIHKDDIDAALTDIEEGLAKAEQT